MKGWAAVEERDRERPLASINDLLSSIAGAWLIAHDQVSAPLDPESGRALLNRDRDPHEERMRTMTDKIKIVPCLWFNKNAEEAARFYAATFPDSRVTAVHRAPADYPNGKAGDVLTVEFTVLGQHFVGLNGGPEFTFDEAISFQVFTDTQEETDRYWKAIVGSDGQESVCGWCKDRFGLSWQIVPRALTEALSDPDTAAARRAMEAMMTMKKVDIARIEAARRGEAQAVHRA